MNLTFLPFSIMLAKNGTVQFPPFTPVHQLCVYIRCDKHVFNPDLWFEKYITEGHAVAGGLLKGYQHVANEISLIAFGHSSCAKSDPASTLSFFLFSF